MAKDLKKLTKTELKKQAKNLDAQREFTVEIGDEEYKMTHDIVFRKTKIATLIDELMDFLAKGVERVELLDLTTPYTALLTIKHFTSIEVPDDIDEALDFLEVLVDLDILNVIIDELPEDQAQLLFDTITQRVAEMTKNLQELEMQEYENLPESE